MNTAALDPRISEFESKEAESSYTQWVRESLARREADEQPRVPHDQVSSRVDTLLERLVPKAA